MQLQCINIKPLSIIKTRILTARVHLTYIAYNSSFIVFGFELELICFGSKWSVCVRKLTISYWASAMHNFSRQHLHIFKEAWIFFSRNNKFMHNKMKGISNNVNSIFIWRSFSSLSTHWACNLIFFRHLSNSFYKIHTRHIWIVF